MEHPVKEEEEIEHTGRSDVLQEEGGSTDSEEDSWGFLFWFLFVLVLETGQRPRVC